jgi:hypothetical protein
MAAVTWHGYEQLATTKPIVGKLGKLTIGCRARAGARLDAWEDPPHRKDQW